MATLVIAFAIALLGYILYRKHKKIKIELKRISSMDIERKKLELYKLQIKLLDKKTNHLLHLFLSLFTLGGWVFVWILVSISNDLERSDIQRLIDSI